MNAQSLKPENLEHISIMVRKKERNQNYWNKDRYITLWDVGKDWQLEFRILFLPSLHSNEDKSDSSHFFPG